LRLVDLRHLGHDRVVGAWLVGDCLVDCGPSSALDGLLAGLGDERPRRLLLTHIHLDHAGAAGTLARRWPELEVWVHERGAKHLVDPTKLLRSATRLYGEAEMERLWGEVLPVPRENVRVLAGGEADGPWRVAYTPGHAVHHVSFLHEPTGTAFVGDTGGVRIPPDGPVLPPTPPPDVDLELWPRSLDAIAAWRPERLALTHFGAWDDVPAHLDALRESLARLAEIAARLDGNAYADHIRAEVAAATDASTAEAYERAMPPETLWPGLDRALRRVTSPPR
jgi:glyoxylase-like metal-dependent hydrolase (beta-lactamase superfamily II)